MGTTQLTVSSSIEIAEVLASRNVTEGEVVTLMSSNCTFSATVLRSEFAVAVANAIAVVSIMGKVFIDYLDDNCYRQESNSGQYQDRLNSPIWWQT